MTAHARQETDTGHAEGEVHIVPPRVLLATFGALLVLTVATVVVTRWDFGSAGNLAIALGIAVVKAGLVALYFMHLRYDRPFNGFLLIVALAFVALLAGTVLVDTEEYQPQLIQGPAPALRR